MMAIPVVVSTSVASDGDGISAMLAKAGQPYGSRSNLGLKRVPFLLPPLSWHPLTRLFRALKAVTMILLRSPTDQSYSRLATREELIPIVSRGTRGGSVFCLSLNRGWSVNHNAKMISQQISINRLQLLPAFTNCTAFINHE